jgi:hypothetical protein
MPSRYQVSEEQEALPTVIGKMLHKTARMTVMDWRGVFCGLPDPSQILEI